MGRHKKCHDDQIIQLRRHGLTCAATAEKLGICMRTVGNCIRRHGLKGKFYGTQKNDKYIVMKPSKPKNVRPSPFSILIKANLDYIDIRLLPTSKAQAQRLIKFLQKEGGEVIFENDAGLENA